MGRSRLGGEGGARRAYCKSLKIDCESWLRGKGGEGVGGGGGGLVISSKNVLSSRHQTPRPVLQVSPEYHVVGRSTVLPLRVSAKSNTIGRGWTGTGIRRTHPAIVINGRIWEPLNKQGRQDSRRHLDWVVSYRAGTWPPTVTG